MTQKWFPFREWDRDEELRAREVIFTKSQSNSMVEQDKNTVLPLPFKCAFHYVPFWVSTEFIACDSKLYSTLHLLYSCYSLYNMAPSPN